MNSSHLHTLTPGYERTARHQHVVARAHRVRRAPAVPLTSHHVVHVMSAAVPSTPTLTSRRAAQSTLGTADPRGKQEEGW